MPALGQATDLIPVPGPLDLPENFEWRREDATEGIGFPDNYFDVFHARALIAAVGLIPKRKFGTYCINHPPGF